MHRDPFLSLPASGVQTCAELYQRFRLETHVESIIHQYALWFGRATQPDTDIQTDRQSSQTERKVLCLLVFGLRGECLQLSFTFQHLTNSLTCSVRLDEQSDFQ